MLSQYEIDYCALVERVLSMPRRSTRNYDTFATFGETLEIDMSKDNYFPLLLGRKMFPKGVLGELAAFFKGPKHIDDFIKEGCNYWGKWADADGALRVDYGNKWLDFNGVNQIEEVLASLKGDPTGRRHLIDAWDPSSKDISLPCCHFLYQWFVRDGYLDMMWYQRSADTMIGIPSDVILAAAWNIVFAKLLGLKPGKIKMVFGDTHIYTDHEESARKYLAQANDTKYASRIIPPAYNFTVDTFSTVQEFNKDTIEIKFYDPSKSIDFELHA